jgi:hypothetical protein
MKVGSLVYATNQGLGILAKSFVENGIITDPFVIEHAHHENHFEWYPGAERCHIHKFHHAKVENFCKKMDIMFFFETPFDWNLIRVCNTLGVKTVLMPMYECMPKEFPRPDLIINPSLLDQQYPEGVFIPVPVSVPWTQRTKADVFVHNAGFGGLKGRNGTRELLEASKLLKSDARILIRSQKPLEVAPRKYLNCVIRTETVPYADLYKFGDVFIFPEKFNGLSLPLQEAYVSGMMVMSTNRFPMNTWLPNEPLIPPLTYHVSSISGRCNEFLEAEVCPETIAQWVDDWYGEDITKYSNSGKSFAEVRSWDNLKSVYKEHLENLL